jgi:hypothetical protein
MIALLPFSARVEKATFFGFSQVIAGQEVGKRIAEKEDACF